jgi:hypothetical protein
LNDLWRELVGFRALAWLAAELLSSISCGGEPRLYPFAEQITLELGVVARTLPVLLGRPFPDRLDGVDAA